MAWVVLKEFELIFPLFQFRLSMEACHFDLLKFCCLSNLCHPAPLPCLVVDLQPETCHGLNLKVRHAALSPGRCNVTCNVSRISRLTGPSLPA